MDDIGNESCKAKIMQAANANKLPKVLLLAGVEGVGKSFFAKKLAKMLLNTDKEYHPDLHEYFPEGKSEMHTIEKMHQLTEEIFKPPYSAAAKVFVLYEADRMLPSSANALLKSFEEPTIDSQVIMVSSYLENMLPTIRSRATTFFFSPIAQESITFFLQKKGVEEEKAKRLAPLSEGSLTNAQFLASDNFLQKEALLHKLFFENVSYEKACEIYAQIDQFSKELHHKETDLICSMIRKWLQEKKQDDFYWKKLDKAMEDFRKGLERFTKFSVCIEYLYLWSLLNAVPDQPNLERSVSK